METEVQRLENNETNQERLVKFLFESSSTFNVPLTDQVSDIPSYVNKLLSLGRVLVILVNNEIAGMIGFYCNDKVNKRIYVSMYCARKDIQRQGLSKNLIYTMCLEGKAEGMQELRLETHDRRVTILHRRMGASILSEEEKNGIITTQMSCDIDTYISNYLRLTKGQGRSK